MRSFRFLQTKLGIIILCLGILGATILHFLGAYHFPTPWDDEAYFLIPAIHFSKNLTLVAPELNAPRGLFWMPHGYPIFIGVLFSILSPSLATARLVSFLLIVTFSICLYVSFRKLDIAPLFSAVAIAVWLISPPVVAIANIARMESLVLAIVGFSLVLIVYQRWLLGVALSSLALLVHPLGIILFLCFLIVAFVFRKNLHIGSQRNHYFWLGVIAGILIVWSAEALYFYFNLDLAVKHLYYNVGNQPNKLFWSKINLITWIFCLTCVIGALICWKLKNRNNSDKLAPLSLLFMLGANFTFYTIIRAEMWYEIYGNLAFLLVAIAAIGMIYQVYSRSSRFKKFLAASLVSILFLVPNGWRFLKYSRIGWNGMSIGNANIKEWNDFLNQVKSQLKNLDNSVDQPTLVKMDAYNSISLFILQENWHNLKFVTPTEVTPIDKNANISYMIFSLDKPTWRSQLVLERLPKTGKIIEIYSRNNNFHLVIFRN